MKRCVIWAAALCVCLMFTGCGFREKKEERTELEFTVVDEERLPEELLKMVGEKKAEPFKLTYGDGG